MKTILVPTDFSDAARNASIYAVDLAKALQCKILLYHAYHIPVPTFEQIPPMTIEVVDELEKGNMIRLKDEVSFLNKTGGVLIDYSTTEGLAVDEIIAIEKSQELCLIIMGMKTREAMNEFVFGSVATDVIRKTQVPVIIVPDKFQFGEIRKIVFASDNNAEMEIRAAFRDIMETFHAKVFILHIVKENKLVEADHGVSGIKTVKQLENVEHVHDFLNDNDLIHGITEFIDHHEIDMVVMVPHKHNLLSRLFRESQTKRMAFHTHVPLLAMPADGSKNVA